MNSKTFAAITVLAILNFLVLAVVQTYYNMQDLAYYENRVSETQEKVDRLSAQGYTHFVIPQIYAQEDDDGTDWMKYCKMAPDFLIAEESCSELVDSNNELTSKGKQKLMCLGGGALAILAPEFALKIASLGSAVGCLGSSNNNEGSSSGLTGLLSRILN